MWSIFKIHFYGFSTDKKEIDLDFPLGKTLLNILHMLLYSKKAHYQGHWTFKNGKHHFSSTAKSLKTIKINIKCER